MDAKKFGEGQNVLI